MDHYERFIDEMERPVAPCWTCKHKHIGAPTCEAFPEQIPDEILSGRNQHDKPYPGDNGIQYEPE